MDGEKFCMKSKDPFMRLDYMIHQSHQSEVYSDVKESLQIPEVNVIKVEGLKMKHKKVCELCENEGKKWCKRCARLVCAQCSEERRRLHPLDETLYRTCDLCVTTCDNSDLMVNLMLEYEIKKQMQKSIKKQHRRLRKQKEKNGGFTKLELSEDLAPYAKMESEINDD